MGAITPSQHERAAVNVVLQSGIFDKAPRLGLFFRYICERHFEGNGDQIKEYSIALEALGRPPDFDPKKDSIVRVEAHRLRKRLQEYYEGPGAMCPVQIVIPNGQYRPQFIVKESIGPDPEDISSAGMSVRSAAPAIKPFALAQVLPEELPGVGKRLFSPGVRTALLLGVLLAVSGSYLLLNPVRKPAPRNASAKEEVWTGPVSGPVPAEFRMLAGYHGPPFVDRQGHAWNADAFYRGGIATPISPGRLIEGQPDPHLLKGQRSGRFQYDIPLGPGTHELRLYFAETEYGAGNPAGGGDGSRMFQVSVNGAVKFSLLDLLAGAGAPNRLYIRVLKDVTPDSDGRLHLRFDPMVGPAVLNGIEILQSPPGRTHPVRIVTQNTPVIDSDGRWWAADEYFLGGTMVSHSQEVLPPPERVLYHGERYGNFAYRIPLAPGKYRMTLHFAETWFGTAASNYADPSSRSFDVYANGTALLRNYQVSKDAGGADRSTAKVFRDLEPNAQGTLLLEFVPVRNYAEVNAIEIVETG
jgi:Malectin domain